MNENTLPKWLREEHCIEHTSVSNRKHSERSIKYYRQLHKATPPWLSKAHRIQIRGTYAEAKRQREQGREVAVDHIVPLVSKIVCGLQVPWNLQIITEKENAAKSNKYWPDHPFENLELFGEFEPYQKRLAL